GVYSADPMKDPSATRFDCITFLEVLERRLKVMDTSAISLCMDNNLPIIVFKLLEPGNIARVVTNASGIGTRGCLEKQCDSNRVQRHLKDCLFAIYHLPFTTVMSEKDVIKETRPRMDHAIDDARRKLATIRTGRAAVSLLDTVSVDYYGTATPLNQMASVHAP